MFSTDFKPHATAATPAGASIGHIVVHQPEETFIAIEADAQRFPIREVRFSGDVLLWERRDGATEQIDLAGSKHIDAVRAGLDCPDGLMILSYDRLSGDFESAQVVEVGFVNATDSPAAAQRLREGGGHG